MYAAVDVVRVEIGNPPPAVPLASNIFPATTSQFVYFVRVSIPTSFCLLWLLYSVYYNTFLVNAPFPGHSSACAWARCYVSPLGGPNARRVILLPPFFRARCFFVRGLFPTFPVENCGGRSYVAFGVVKPQLHPNHLGVAVPGHGLHVLRPRRFSSDSTRQLNLFVSNQCRHTCNAERQARWRR